MWQFSFSNKKWNLELIKTLPCDQSTYLSWCVECFCGQKVECFISNFWECPKMLHFHTFCHNAHVYCLKPCHLATFNHLLYNMWSFCEKSGMFWPFVRNCLINIFFLSTERSSPFFSLNTLCRWLTIGDSTLCEGLTTSLNRPQNSHFVNICWQWCRWHRWL